MSPNNCWLANTVITIQSVYALLLNAVVLGIVFARISRPGQRVSALFHSPPHTSGSTTVNSTIDRLWRSQCWSASAAPASG